jgi:hypothetical protein
VGSNKKPIPLTHADVVFALHYLQTQLQALHALLETAQELAPQEVTKTTWGAAMENISTQLDVISRLTVVWPQ